MKYKIQNLAGKILLITEAFAFPLMARADAPPVGGGGGAIKNPIPGITSVMDLIGNILKIVMMIGIPLCALAIIYAGFLFVTAGGKDAQVTEARKAFFAAVVGTAIILGAFVIVKALQGTIGGLTG